MSNPGGVRLTRSGGRSGGKRRIWCARHSAWHSPHAAEHCKGIICRWWKAGQGRRCPMHRGG